MSEIAIKVEGLSKLYRLGTRRERYRTLREVMMSSVRGLFNRGHNVLSDPTNSSSEEFWALKDVSFDINQGEVVGVIGRNGAGKSTLLKILSRITEPTTGHAEIRGRVGSLLEVGTGFHPELTGRENIYLNGAILGMRRTEINQKFDEIVAFAEVERFIDTPVKHYSSGMYLRLAFAVAAHLDPEILVVDEVLAVGDAAFQKKCLGKMGEVSQGGRTVLFVSHNMAAVLSLCSRAFLLDRGQLVCGGPTESVVNRYLELSTLNATTPLSERQDRGGDGTVLLTSIKVTNGSNDAIKCGDRLHVTIGYKADKPLLRPSFLVGIYDQFNRPIYFLDSELTAQLPDVLLPEGVVTCTTDPINLTPGPCIVNLAVKIGGALADHVTNAYVLEIYPDDFYGTGKMTSRQVTLCLTKQCWQVS